MKMRFNKFDLEARINAAQANKQKANVIDLAKEAIKRKESLEPRIQRAKNNA